MADLLGSLEKIIKVGLAIKEAVETVHKNEEECRNIHNRVATVTALLLLLKRTAVVESPEIGPALEELEESLHEALKLITDCQKKNTVCLFCTARGLCKQLHQVHEDISRKVQTMQFAVTMYHLTIVLAVDQGHGRGAQQQVTSGAANSGDLDASASLSISQHHAQLEPTMKKPDEAYSSTLLAPSHSLTEVVHQESLFLDWALVSEDTIYSHSARLNELNEENVSAGVSVSAVTEMSFPSLTGLRMFNLSELEAATNEFSDENIIGKGGCAVVYKGVLHDGQVVAVKEIEFSTDHTRDKTSYLYNELNIRSKLDHVNTVKPLGYYHGYLVEEYMPNGSLRNIIEDGSRSRHVDWSTRFRIIQGIAHGVQYLYEQGIVHRDLAPSNILLDSEMHAKITDFGVAKKLRHSDECIDDELFVVGTLGYIAPEVFDGAISAKVDVYSFGRLILEIVGSARRPGSQPSSSVAWAFATAGQQVDVTEFDLELVEESQLEEIQRCVQIGLRCMEHKPGDRPTMGQVVDMLLHGNNGDTEATETTTTWKGLIRQLMCSHQ